MKHRPILCGTPAKRISLPEIFCAVLLLAFLVRLLFACLHTGTFFIGEAASYSLTSVSLAHDGNGFVSSGELALAQTWFPDWASQYESFAGSGYALANGDVVPWYFPTYSACCVPMLWLLRLLGRPMSGAFCLTNFVLYALLLVLVFTDRRRMTLPQRILMTLLLGINPILFYLEWASAETFLYTFVALACWCWVTGRRHRAALCIALAGTMNPCALALGLVMIAEYLGGLLIQAPKGAQLRSVFAQWRSVILYGCCYLPGLVPFAYNYAICGSINLTASHSNEIADFGDGTVLRQLLAYFLDLNFGLLPYFGPLLLVALLLVVPAVRQRIPRYPLMLLAMTAMLFGCSFMANINCGMAGIARYNVWSAAALCTAVGYYLPHLLHRRALRTLGALSAAACYLYTGLVIAWYGGLETTQNVSYLYATPITELVVARWPALYHPLQSTFAARSNASPGSSFEYYRDDNLHLRKLLADASNREMILESVAAQDPQDLAWLEEQLQSLGETARYIDIPLQRQLYIKTRTLVAGCNELSVDGVYDSAGAFVQTSSEGGFSMTGPGDDLGAGHYTVTLYYEAGDTCQAQFQITRGYRDEMELLAYCPIDPSAGEVSLSLEVPTPLEDVDYRIYQEPGSSLRFYAVQIQRDR